MMMQGIWRSRSDHGTAQYQINGLQQEYHDGK